MFPHYEQRNNENISKHRCCEPYSSNPKRITREINTISLFCFPYQDE